MRALVVLLCVAGCVDDGGADDDYPVCSAGEGPSHFTIKAISLNANDLTCTEFQSEWGCSGTCCHAQMLGGGSISPVPCTGTCVGLDETSCLQQDCYVARDMAAFYVGAPDSFLGCYPDAEFSSTSKPCSERTAGECASDGACAGLYDATKKFVECVNEQLVAGSCSEPATCTTTAPTCPADRTPGVADGCYTRACIPNASCG